MPPPDETAQLRYALVVDSFQGDGTIAHEKAKGFGSGSLKVNGKIFAMFSSQSKFVVKLSSKRVEELIGAGIGSAFAPSPKRVMKEWLTIDSHADWITLAREAHRFVKMKGK